MAQTRRGAATGNCFEASLASILEIPLDEIPVQRADQNGHMDDWLYGHLNPWLRERHELELYYVPVLGADGGEGRISLDDEIPDGVRLPSGWWIAGVESSADTHYHALVMLGREIVHDPQTGDRGEALRRWTGEVWLTGVFAFMVVDPGSWRRR